MAKRVFFSFHYQDVVDFRANVVRNAWVVPTAQDGREAAGFFDSSIWETNKRFGDAAIKRLINSGLDQTTVTVALVGSFTYSRRWVRYELIKSIERGNKVFGVHINGIPGKDKMTKAHGADPFDHLAVKFNEDGTKATPWEYVGTEWKVFADADPFQINQRPREDWGKIYKLSHWYVNYDWVAQSGSAKFSAWVG